MSLNLTSSIYLENVKYYLSIYTYTYIYVYMYNIYHLEFNMSYYCIDRPTDSPRKFSSEQKDFRDERFTVRMHGNVSKRSSKPSLHESVGKSEIEPERERE